MTRAGKWTPWLWAGIGAAVLAMPARAEVMVQWFNTTWKEMIEKIPLMAEIGYGSIYVPVPNKGGSQWSVGYDLHDRFDLGDQDQNGTIATKYGTKHELLKLVELAHRFGIRVYFDNVMNHNSFGVPGYDESTPITLYPDMLPEDFHLIQTDTHFWRKSGSIQQVHYDTGDHGAIQHYTLSDLTDISNESGNWDIPGSDLSFVRQSTEPDKYPDLTDPGNYIQDADGNRVYKYSDTNRPAGDPVSEDVNAYLIRAARWTMHETKCDGFRFDAAKHVVPDFFGEWKGAGNWGSYLGYCGAIQAEYDILHGFNDGDTRNSLFDEDAPRDDAMLFGEVVPHKNLDLFDYVRRGMRLLDFDYEGTASYTLDGWGDQKYAGNLQNMGRLGPDCGVMQPMNHDHPQFADMDMLSTWMILRDGIALVYTDGNNHSLPDQWGRVFPEQGQGNFLGQYQNANVIDRLPMLMDTPGPESEISRSVWIHQQFVRGWDDNKWSSDDVVVNQKVYSQNYKGASYNNNEGAVLLVAINDDKYSGQTHYVNPFTHFRPGTLLYNYATRHNGWDQDEWVRVGTDWKVNLRVPPGHYAAYSIMVPGRTAVEPSSPILIEQPAGTLVGLIPVIRTDGLHGDEDWDDDGIPNDEDPVYIQRVSGNDPIRFVSRSDGLTVSAMIRLDGGLDVNGDGLDNPAGQATDVYLGYEPMAFRFRRLGETYFGIWDALVSDMDSTDGNEADFWNRHNYESEYEVTNIAATAFDEGYHMVRTRLFRKRQGGPNDGCDLYNTFTKTFYVDRLAPTGVIGYPRTGETFWSREYGMAFRTDDTVTKVLVHIDDSDPANDDSVTGLPNGNGTSTNGVDPAWEPATASVPNPGDAHLAQYATNYPKEWRFTYRDIPSSGSATIQAKLHEDSSAADPARITTLTSTHACRAPDARLHIAWPPHGSTISFTDYEIVVQFTDCRDGGAVCLSTNPANFSVLIDNAFQPRAGYVLRDNQGGDGFGELRLAWSNFSAGTHTILALYEDDDYELQASAEVRTTAERSLARFIQPPPLDLNGNPYVIVAPYPPPPFDTTLIAETSPDVRSLRVEIDGGTWGGAATLVSSNATAKSWTFAWNGLGVADEGEHALALYGDTDGNPASDEVEARQTTRLDFRQTVEEDDADDDDDDDGLTDWEETVAYDLFTDKPLATDWNNGDVHRYYFAGRTDALSPDTDDDGLPDGLELGLASPLNPAATDLAADTDGDGFKNFLADLDPPLFNTDDNSGHPNHVAGGDRLMRIAGSTTDPLDPDSDGDGLYDGIEDANRNGRLDAGETDPNNPDTDGDGKLDGTEDINQDGLVAGDANSNRVYDAGEAWLETDPLNADTDGDGLPDGWENRSCLSALDNGTNSLSTAAAGDGTVDFGPAGNPDLDALSNLQEYTGGTDPCYADNGQAQPGSRITIGAGKSLGTLAGVDVSEQFTDWAADDCHTLDEVHGAGNLRERGDVYFWNDGYDTSRDLVAFYSRDGRDLGEFYFRLDFHDLQYQAEEGHMDFYIVIDTGNTATGEKALPDSVNCASDMGWELVVAVYETGIANVLIDQDHLLNTVNSWDDLSAHGVVSRPDFIRGVSFRADYDAVELAIDRAALIQAGWNGISELHYQVYATRDGTQDSPRGPGDVGGTSDLADAIIDDERGSDDGVLNGWISQGWKANRAKLAVLLHGNQPAVPASEIQKQIRSGTGDSAAGYFRALDANEFFGLPLNLRISGQLASTLEWAASDTDPQKDGPAFNARIRGMVREGQAALLAGPYAEQALPFFNSALNQASLEMNGLALNTIYGTSFPNWWDVHFYPERMMDGPTLTQLAGLGAYFGVVDQYTHLYNWFGREAALKEEGFKLNDVNGVKLFAINQQAADDIFVRHDGGLSLGLRGLLSKKANEWWARDQAVVMFSLWENFGNATNAAAYDRNLDWIANHPWIQVVTLEQIAKGEVDITGDGAGDYWSAVSRGSGLALSPQANDYVHFSSGSNCKNWYDGSANEESLRDRKFTYEGAAQTVKSFGGSGTAGTILGDAWAAVSGAGTSREGLLGRLALCQGLWETAFHNEDESDRSRWSYGAYKYPDSNYDTLAGFALTAQAQARLGALYGRAAQWAAALPAGATNTAEDVDLDGESEYLLCNQRVFAVFEDNGGRMIAAFVRDPASGRVFQGIGNTLAYAEGESEDEGVSNLDGSGNPLARRTSALKDWWAAGPDTNGYVNGLYAAAAVAGGWRLTSVDGKIQKTVTLASATATTFEVQYQVQPSIPTLYVRHGLAPNLYSLALNGQKYLSGPADAGGRLTLAQDDRVDTVVVSVGYADAGHGAAYNPAAVDHGGAFASRNLRNQAQVQQVELSGSGTFAFDIRLSAGRTDTDGDGTPNETDTDDDNDGYSDDTELHVDALTGERQSDPWDAGSVPPDLDGDGITDALDADRDGDGVSDDDELTAGTDPRDGNSALVLNAIVRPAGGRARIDWPTVGGRRYTIGYARNEAGQGLAWYDIPETAFQVWETDVAEGAADTESFTDDGTLTGSPAPVAYRVHAHAP